MRIGFTGTRNGMSPDQLETLACLMQFEWTRLPTRAIHGDCVGADAQFFAAGALETSWQESALVFAGTAFIAGAIWVATRWILD